MVRAAERCNLCFTRITDDEHLGSALKWSGLVVHAHCLMMCPDVKRRSNDDVCHADVLHCIQRRSSVSCVHCGLAGAAAQCRTCGEAYHLPCGLLSGAWPVFSSSPHSYCSTHRPGPDVPPAHTQGQAQACVFCAHGDPSLWAPCCNSGYHRACLQKETSSENVKLNCQVCGEGRKYISWVVRCGIFLPPRKLQAEEFPLQCSVRDCSLAGKVSRGGAQWELVRCDLCWYQAAHRKCTQSARSARVWHCLDCSTDLNHCDDTGVLTSSRNQSLRGQKKRENPGDTSFDDQSSKFPNKQSLAADARFIGDSDGCNEYQSRAVLSGKKSYKCGYDGCEERFARTRERCAHEKTHNSKESIPCDYDGCKRTFRISFNLAQHQRCHVEGNRYKCGYAGCRYATLHVYTLKQHQRIHTRMTYECDYYTCDLKFNCLTRLNAHKVRHTPEKGNSQSSAQKKRPGSECPYDASTKSNEGVFKCNEIVSVQKERLNTHKLIHTGKQTYKCLHIGCNFTSAYKHNLKRHQNSHLGKKNYQCFYDGCEAVLSTQQSWDAHQTLHTGDSPFVCDYEGCHRKFISASGLRHHVLRHSGVKPFSCQYSGCKAAFFTKHYLKVHERVHTGEKPYICNYNGCNAKFSHASAIAAHKRHHLGIRPYKCDFGDCSATFSRSQAFIVHYRIHTGERPYRCKYRGCDVACRSAATLSGHMQRHTNNKRFKCNFCQKAFHYPEDRTRHHRTHTGEKPYKCKYVGCSAAFTTSSSRHAHQRRHHPDTSL